MIELKGAYSESLECIVFSPDGESLAAVGQWEGIIRWRLSESGYPSEHVSIGYYYSNPKLEYSPNGAAIIGVSGPAIRIFDCSTLKRRVISVPRRVHAWCVVDDTRIWIETDPSRACINLESGKSEWRKRRNYSFQLRPVVRQPVSGLIAGGGDRQIEFRSAETGELQKSILVPSLLGGMMSFSPDGRVVATGQNTRLHICDAELGDEITQLRTGSRYHFTGIAFHPNGAVAATTSNDRIVRIWDCSTWKEITTFTWDIGAMRSVAFAPDGLRMAAGSSEGRVMVWDVDF